MKKIIATAALSIMSMTLFAQESEDSIFAQDSGESNTTPTDKFCVSTNAFFSNWFVTLQGTYSGFKDGGSGNGILDNPMWGGSIALGKWFTPGLGLRAKMSGWNMKNALTEKLGDYAPYRRHNRYWTLTGEAMFNLSNLFNGYSETRVWNLIPYASAGFARNCTAGHYVPVFGAGVISTWKVAKKVNVNIDCSYKALSNDFAGNIVAGAKPKSADRMLAIEVGLTYRLGNNSWKHVPDVNTISTMTQMEIDALNAQIADLEAENERLRKQCNGGNAETPEDIIPDSKD